MTDENDHRDRAEKLLRDLYSDRVFSVEDGIVWVSGMNENCRFVARSMAETLVKHDIPAGLVHDDDAVDHGGVQFRYGENA